MNRKPASGEDIAKRQALRAKARASAMKTLKTIKKTERCATARRILVLFALILLTALFVDRRSWPPPMVVPAPQTVSVLAGNHSGNDFHYFRSGQWLADLRSLVAAYRYLLQPEPA